MPLLGRLLVVGGILAFAGCGSVHGTPAASDDAGTDSGGGGSACMSNDQCSAPTPVCDPGNGCVECLQSDQCSAAKPNCDTSTHTCRECAADADCDSDVCDLASGVCVAEADVLYASPTGLDAGTCPKGSPCSIAQASAVADQTRNNVKLAAGAYSAHIILTNKTLVFFGVGATVNNQGTDAIFEVDDGAHLRIVGVSLTGATGNSVIRCEGSASASHVLEIFGATIQNDNIVLLANPCTLTVDQSVIRNTAVDSFQVAIVGPSVATFDRTRFDGNGGGLAGLSNATIKITNSELTNVGDPTQHGAFVGGNFDVSFSTIVGGVVECSTQGAVGLTLDSSIVVNTSAGAPADTLIGIPSCTGVHNSIVFPNQQPVGATNVMADPHLKNIAAEDYHLLVTSPALDHGDPASTNAVDFDGISRPQGAGPDSGAFEFKP